MSPALLDLEQVRAAVEDVTVLDFVTLRTTGNRVGLAGRAAGISALLIGEAQLITGTFLVLGQPLHEARANQLFGCAVPPRHVPKKWTVRRVLELAAQIAGNPARDAARRATAAAEAIGEPSILKCRWSRAQPIEQALATLALGLVTDPPLLFARLPLGSLHPTVCPRYGAALAQATESRALLAEVARSPEDPCERGWVESLNSISYVLDGRDVGSGGPPSKARVRYILRVVGESTSVGHALTKAGLLAMPIHAPSDWSRGRCAFLVDVDRDPEGMADTGPLLDVCIDTELTVLELLPV